MFNILEFVRQKIPFLEAKEALKVITNSELKKVKAGDILIKEGETTNVTAYIANGLVRIFVYKEGEEKTVLFRKEGEFVGAPPAMFRGQPAVENVIAVEDCLLLIIDWKGFRELAKKSRPLANAYTFVMEDMMLDAVERIQDFTVLSPEERYLKFLKEHKDILNRVQLKYIASYIGVTEQSLSRIRARLAKSRT